MKKMYEELASWWPVLSPPGDYAEEAAFYGATLVGAGDATPRTLLELGSGGGNNASFMKKQFDEVVLVDLSPQMLAVSRELNPDCEHVEGDMRTIRLGRTFDRVFVHDAITYMATESDLRLALETAFEHCEPGGAALFAPDHVRETFAPPYTDNGGEDAPDRSLRYLEWCWDPDPADDTYTVLYVYALREGNGAVRIEHDEHLEGVFSRDTWLRLLREVGFEPSAVRFDHSELEPGSYELFLGVRPHAASRIVVAADAGIAIRTLRDVSDIVGAALGADGVLLTEADLGPEFFDLRSGLAGELLQKFVNYRMRVAIVLSNPDAHGERFRELVREHRTHPDVRFVATLAEAEAWLKA